MKTDYPEGWAKKMQPEYSALRKVYNIAKNIVIYFESNDLTQRDINKLLYAIKKVDGDKSEMRQEKK